MILFYNSVMNLVETEIPTSYAVELLSLGLDMREQNIDRIPCRVPCIESDRVLIPTMEGKKGKYSMHPFAITVVSDESTGGGFVTLTPEATDQRPDPRIGIPIYKPDDAERSAPHTFRQIVGSRVGYAALRSSFGIETTVSPMNGRERYVGMAVLAGELADGSERTLHLEAGALSFYMGLLKNVGTAKLQKLLAERQTVVAPALFSTRLELVV